MGKDDTAIVMACDALSIPAVDQFAARRFTRIGNMEHVVVAIGLKRFGGFAGCKLPRCIPLPILALPPDLGNLDAADPFGNGAESCACLNRLQLLRITDQD